MDEKQFRQELAELAEILGKIIAGALAIGDLANPSVRREVADLLQREVAAFREESGR